MELNKYTWNNGTQSNPIVLTKDQIKKLIAIGQREDIESDIRGWITTSSRKIQKFLKYTLEQQFPNLNIICDEELSDTFTINTFLNIIEEGTKETINIVTNSGITHEFLQWKYDYSDFVIDGDISEQNIKDRIRVENGQLVIDDPQENVSWSVQLTLTAYPIYYSSKDFDNIPITSKPNIILTISAKKIEDISINVDSEISINSSVNVQITPIPTNSTKLKGAKYYYSTTTPDIISINTSTAETKIITKQFGTANLTVTINALNNIFNKSKSVTFNVYDLQPIRFTIDQRYNNNLSDPYDMVSGNYILNTDGTLKLISNNGAEGNVTNNVITWIRKNTHAYVGYYTNSSGMRLKQLSDTTRKKFADGTSSVAYITGEKGDYDVWLKFGSDICWKIEPYSTDPDYIIVTICNEIPAGEDEAKWQKWSKNKLIGVYKATQINNKLYSISGRRPTNNINQTDCKDRARARGKGFIIVDYQMNCLIALLFYGYYSSLDSQGQCGYGTTNLINGTCYPKLTGLTDDLGMTDTNDTTGNGSATPNEDQIKAGEGSDIKSVNFWGLDNCWGDISEWIDNLHVMQTRRPNNTTTVNVFTYLEDYLDVNPSIELTEDGVTRTITKADVAEFNTEQRFIFINDSKANIQRIIKTFTGYKKGYINKMQFGDHADIFVKNFGASSNTGFCDYSCVDFANRIARRSGDSNHPNCGVGYLDFYFSSNSIHHGVGSRLLFEGTDDNIHIIDDATETL